MDIALEVVSAFATAPGATESAFAAVAGNSLTVRDAKAAKLVAQWGKRQTDGNFRLTSPLLHDAVVGINYQLDTLDATEMRLGVPQKLTPQDTLTAAGTGSATAGDIENNSYLVMYEQLAGICGKFITWEQLMANAVDLYDSTNTLTTGTSGGYSGQELLNAEEDQLKANMDYAIIGASKTSTSGLATIRYISPDWGNLGVGLPAFDRDLRVGTAWFMDLSKRMGMPLIPVFNASQKSSVFIDALNDEDGGSPTITTQMVQLKPGTFGTKARKV